MRTTPLTIVFLLAVALAAGGCTNLTGPTDASPMSSADIRDEMTRMKAEPAELERPVAIIDGWLNLGGAAVIERELLLLTGADDDEFVRHSYALIFSSLESNARRTIELIEENWPSDDPEWTTEVDVVGYSMGGIIARVGALPPAEGQPPRKRLRIRRLFTIASPHRGVGPWLGWAMIDQMSWAASLYAGSYRAWLDEGLRDAEYELLCYGQGNDWVVGSNYAPPGYGSIRAGGQFVFSHITAYGNHRHLADIAARLRGEEPLSPTPPVEVPAAVDEDEAPGDDVTAAEPPAE
ncbi:MAG: esterase/lipase family protein [Planctomycetota bacterium]|jgi:pimeloyl-ACP methyl ester carboxylesterase